MASKSELQAEAKALGCVFNSKTTIPQLEALIAIAQKPLPHGSRERINAREAEWLAQHQAPSAPLTTASASTVRTASGTLSATTITNGLGSVTITSTLDPAPPLPEPADPALGPGLVEHGVGLGRHRVEDGPVAPVGTVVLVTPERG